MPYDEANRHLDIQVRALHHNTNTHTRAQVHTDYDGHNIHVQAHTDTHTYTQTHAQTDRQTDREPDTDR